MRRINWVATIARVASSFSVALLLCTIVNGQESPRSNIVVADFEGQDYGDWKVDGTAFGNGPAQGRLPGQMPVDGFVGKGLVNSFLEGDNSIGTLASPEFKIERKFISFLIGGGMNAEQLSLQLLVDGKIVRQATGPNNRPGGSETLMPDYWDVTELLGKNVSIRILDQAKGGWGHINVDQLIQTDQRPKGMIKDAKRNFEIGAKYLHIPIKNGATKRVVTVLVDGKVAVRNDIELADENPDWWAPMDVSSWNGKTITLVVDTLHEDSRGLSAIEANNSLKDADTLYAEPLRGQFHFSPRRGWNNDPNGMVYYQGEYHLFFQHNPYGWAWGNMHWGHAVSKDMVHWKELGDKLLPDNMGPMFSGSAVVDWNNTSGFGEKNKPPMVLFYTAAGNPAVQCIAYSTDGRNFTKYGQNPVLKQITGGNRDPKVFWHEPSKKWVMVLYVELKGGHTIHFFNSDNLKDWIYVSKTDGFYECPDFFELPIDGDAANRKWVLIAASSEYRVGSFDGRSFLSESPKIPGHRGKGFYAAQSFSDIPSSDGRRIFIGWFQTETRGMSFNQGMTIPLELRLTNTMDGPRLTFAPIKELESLRKKSHSIVVDSIKPGDPNPLSKIQGELLEIRAEFEPGEASDVVFSVRGATIVWNAKSQELIVNGHRASAPLRKGRQAISIYCDRTGLEIFASDGLCYVPIPFIPKSGDQTVSLSSTGGEAKVVSLAVHELGSAWVTQLEANQHKLGQ